MTLPVGVTSYWLDNWAQTYFDPTLLSPYPTGKWGGNRPGVTLTNSGALTVSTASATIENLNITGALTINANDVKIINCKVTASGFVLGTEFACGSTANLVSVNVNVTEPPFLVDCEFYGGKSIQYAGGGYRLGCYGTEGNDLTNLRPLKLRDAYCCWDGPKKSGPTSHSDVYQATNNAPSTTVYDLLVWRCWMEAKWRRGDSLVNSCDQLGAFGSTVAGVEGSFRECYFSGGNYTVAWSTPHGPVGFYNNVFGREHRYGAVYNNSYPPSGYWSGNKYADNGQAV